MSRALVTSVSAIESGTYGEIGKWISFHKNKIGERWNVYYADLSRAAQMERLHTMYLERLSTPHLGRSNPLTSVLIVRSRVDRHSLFDFRDRARV
jgi:hypothetical protein